MIDIVYVKDGYVLYWENGEPWKYEVKFNDYRSAVNYCIDHNLSYRLV